MNKFIVGTKVIHIIYGEGVVTNDKPTSVVVVGGIPVRFLNGHCESQKGFYMAIPESLTIIEHVNLENV